ncbi:sensor histidine kinase [Candidatus Leptofilum sp.]|uniref:sensor histidine kinase n=1 Tax=Candidatus Leptofilum sp. TaxID=3241576 RepID=UPI003B5C6609
MIENETLPKREVWEQWDWVWHLTGYATLAINVVIALRDGQLGDSLPLFLTLSALVALWYIPFVATPIARWWNAPRHGLLYFLIGFALWGGLLALNVTSLMLAAMFNPMIFTRFPIRWAIGIMISLTVGFLLLYLLRYSPENWLIIVVTVLVLLFIAVLMGYFISAIAGQSMERQRLLDELTQTRASLLKAEREAGMLAERQRLARDIHDTLAQQFTSIIMHLSAARLGDTAALQTHMQQVEQAAREGLNESRRIIWDMRPQLLEDATLVESIEGVVARWSAENKVQVETAVTGSPHPLDESIETALLRITQEALHNIKKHARAQAVNITLSYMPDLLALDIADDGKGFDTSRRNGRGFGLKTMGERAEELGGTLTIESELGEGTAVAVSLPIAEEL